jgi:hypothetical protein
MIVRKRGGKKKKKKKKKKKTNLLKIKFFKLHQKKKAY